MRNDDTGGIDSIPMPAMGKTIIKCRGKSKSDIGIFIVSLSPALPSNTFNGTEQERFIHVPWERELQLLTMTDLFLTDKNISSHVSIGYHVYSIVFYEQLLYNLKRTANNMYPVRL
jgi:hypothetical protein